MEETLDIMPYAEICVRCGEIIPADVLVYRQPVIGYRHERCPNGGGVNAYVRIPDPDGEMATV